MGVWGGRPKWTMVSWLRVAMVAVLATGGLFVFAPPAAAAAPPVMTAAALNSAFNAYGDAGGHWTGGDGTTSVALPDGRVAWLFSDTFLGTVNADHTRAASTPMVNNTIVVQSGTALGATLTGGTASDPQAVVIPTDGSGEFYWNGDGIVEGGVLKVIYNRYRKTGTGSLDFTRTGTALATFALPALTLTSVTGLSVGSDITWGAALVPNGSYTYIYGMSTAPGRMNFAHIARAAAGSLGGPWEYWTGSAWTSSPDSPARLLSGVGTNYSVQQVGTQYVLVTQDSNLIFDPQMVAYTATSPTGPWTGPTVLYTAPEPAPGSATIVYDAQLHPSLAATGKLLMSYNVNSLTYADNLADARLYRPRFVEITWPVVPPTGTPAAPGGLAVTGQNDYANLTWSAVSGATSYRVWQRDVTGGQTHFARQPTAATTTSFKAGFLIAGHQYEFKVTAANANGEGAFGATATVTPQSAVPVATAVRGTDLTGVIAGSYIVRLRGTGAQPERLAAYAQQLVTQAGGTLGALAPYALHGFGATLTPAQAINLAAHPDVLDVAQNHTYAVAGEQANPPWHLDRIDQRALPRDQKYRYPNDGTGVRAYVVDTGIRASHQEFGGRVLPGYNVIDGGTDTPDCGGGHGTGVASMLGGATYGVAKNVQMVPVKVFSCDAQGDWYGNAFGIALGIDYAIRDAAQHKPALINLSLSGSADGKAMDTTDDAVVSAVAAGLTVVMAAGNDDEDACTWSPAHMSETTAAITVGAVDAVDRSASFSNGGTCVDIQAPGEAVTMAGYDTDTATVTDDGTSFAAPMVAGAAAILLQSHPGYSPADVKRTLLAAATPNVVTNLPAGTPNRLLYIEQPLASAPADLAATAQPDGNIGLSWSAVNVPNVQYLVSSRDVTAGETAFVRWPNPIFNATTAIATGLVEGHTYDYRVAAANSAGTGPESNVASAVSHIAPPAAPTGLTATALTDGQIRLNWNLMAANIWYWIYQRDLTAGDTEFTKLPLPSTTNTVTVGYLVDGHQYEYAVTGFNQGGEGPKSATAQATSNYPPPAVPTNLAAVAGNGTVALSWTASTSPGVWYWIYQRDVTAGQTTFAQLEYPVTECCTVSLGWLTNGDTYEYKVTAVGTGGESAASNVASATPNLPVPGAVTALTATAGTDGSIKLDWTAPGPDLWFDIWMRDVTAGQTLTKLIYPVTTCCTWTAGSLTQNHVYEFKVDAINATGAGPLSNLAVATAHYNPPAAPRNLRGKSAGDGTIDLDWDAPAAGGFYYWIYFRDVTAGATFSKGIYPTDKTTVSLGSLADDHVYEFKVTAENSGGEGPATAAVQVTSHGGTPAAPSGLTATAGNGQATLKWTASPTANVLYYLYQRDVTTGQSWQPPALPISGTAFTATSLVNGHAYEWKVSAGNSSGEGKASNVAGATPMPPLPAAPSGLTATAGDGMVSLHWTASSTPSVYYWLESRPAGGTWKQALYPIETCCSFDVRYLANGTTYEFRLKSTNLAGDSGASNTASARPMPPLPSAPSGLTATAGDGKVSLHWTASSTPNVYYWIEMQSSGGSWSKLKYPVSTCCSFPVSGLLNGTTYGFRLRATNLSGDSGASNAVSARPMPPLPSAPTNLRVVGQTADHVDLDWGPSTPSNVYYTVQVRNISRNSGWSPVQRYLTLTGHKIYFLIGGDQYQIRVGAENLAGSGDWSNVVSVLVPYTFAGITCVDHSVRLMGIQVGWTEVTTSATGVAPAANMSLTVTRKLYIDDQRWITTDDYHVTTDANGRWRVADQTHEGNGNTYRVYVTVRGPNGEAWQDDDTSCISTIY